MTRRPAPRTAADARAQLRESLDDLRTARLGRSIACGASMREAVRAARAPCAAAVRKAQAPCKRAKAKVGKTKRRARSLRADVSRLKTDREARETDLARLRKRRQRERDDDAWHNADGFAGKGDAFEEDQGLRTFVLTRRKTQVKQLVAQAKKRGKRLQPHEAVDQYIHDHRSELEAAHAEASLEKYTKQLEAEEAKLYARRRLADDDEPPFLASATQPVGLVGRSALELTQRRLHRGSLGALHRLAGDVPRAPDLGPPNLGQTNIGPPDLALRRRGRREQPDLPIVAPLRRNATRTRRAERQTARPSQTRAPALRHRPPRRKSRPSRRTTGRPWAETTPPARPTAGKTDNRRPPPAGRRQPSKTETRSPRGAPSKKRRAHAENDARGTPRPQHTPRRSRIAPVAHLLAQILTDLRIDRPRVRRVLGEQPRPAPAHDRR